MRRTLVAMLTAGVLVLAGTVPTSARQASSLVRRPKVFLVTVRFVPADMTITAGQSVKFVNSSLLPHNVHVPGLDFNTNPSCTVGAMKDCLRFGERVQIMFPEPGEYAYHCDVHSAQGMEGVITVMPAA